MLNKLGKNALAMSNNGNFEPDKGLPFSLIAGNLLTG
jgi:hypothetical protein